ncbi:MAG: hypothetical protein MZV70_46035 [Desulfobacterales bacterium]|nr:hypothetical protein [Desulfobacterales bacterium]
MGRVKNQGPGEPEIAYQDKDPIIAMLVANELASLFIDENIKMRESKAAGTSEFLEAELESSRKRLETLELELNEYRQKYMGELPEQLNTNLRILDRLNASLNERKKFAKRTRQSLWRLKTKWPFVRMLLLAEIGADSASGPGAKMQEELMSVHTQMKEKLAKLRLSYTDQHPDVIRLKAED